MVCFLGVSWFDYLYSKLISLFYIFILCPYILYLWNCTSYIMRNLKILVPLYSILSQVGLQGEFLKFYSEENENSEWVELTPEGIPSTFTWYKVIMICWSDFSVRTVVVWKKIEKENSLQVIYIDFVINIISLMNLRGLKPLRKLVLGMVLAPLWPSKKFHTSFPLFLSLDEA